MADSNHSLRIRLVGTRSESRMDWKPWFELRLGRNADADVTQRFKLSVSERKDSHSGSEAGTQADSVRDPLAERAGGRMSRCEGWRVVTVNER